MILGTCCSPLTPLKKGGTGIKVPLFKGDLEGSRTFDTDKRTFQTSSEVEISSCHCYSTFKALRK
ncbi:hypothetical protein FNW02_04975 [Komarekiella sp. 'clone 1']|uniref:Uncharacterized protein n=1 Tax=Komarekiella delphini-convector SJRDD-AB1 TaxID=2593771 RepID=A0AA40SUD6_9NOST|nr:hypothetical protein [Komarekiella delphini-convector SJRDD-AB1]